MAYGCFNQNIFLVYCKYEKKLKNSGLFYLIFVELIHFSPGLHCHFNDSLGNCVDDRRGKG